MSQPTLFQRDFRPLAERMRPQQLSEVIGQKHLFKHGAPLEVAQRTGQVGSLVLHGPPGVGKTTIARLLADSAGMEFVAMSATSAGAAELREVIKEAQRKHQLGKRTMLFLDEAHRWNKTQQDVLLPHMESGLLTVIGATTEHPSYALNSAILSRVSAVLKLEQLNDNDMEEMLKRAEEMMSKPLPLTPEARALLRRSSAGDGRALITRAEQIWRANPDHNITDNELPDIIQARAAGGDISEGYDILSALHKSMRASDESAALYWAARLLDAGEDPRTIMRRVACVASEDVGLADPQAMVQAHTAWQLVEKLGMPEGRLPMAQAIIYVTLAPKSNRSYLAFNKAIELAQQTRNLIPPASMQVAATALQRAEGRGAEYAYDHNHVGAFSGQQRLPDQLAGTEFYQPSPRGWEATHLPQRLEKWRSIRAKNGVTPTLQEPEKCPVEKPIEKQSDAKSKTPDSKKRKKKDNQSG